MRNLTMMLAAIGAVLFAAPAVWAQKVPNEGRDMMREVGGGGIEGDDLKHAIEQAELNPLGSKENPVRENMPRGEYRYLGRLRCADGSRPEFERQGNVGAGIYNNIVDLFEVRCEGQAPVSVYMDMYHDGPENRPIPGFTIKK